MTVMESQDLTREVGKQRGLPDAVLNKCVEVANGNVGAMVYLTDIRKTVGDGNTILLCSCLKMKDLTGPAFYSFMKTYGFDEAIHRFRAVGWI